MLLGTPKHGRIGIDLGAGAIKVAQTIRRRRRYELVDAAVVCCAADEFTLRDRLQGVLSLADRLQGRHAAAVLSQSVGECRMLRIPGVRPGAAPDFAAVQRAASAVSRTPLKDCIYGAWPLPIAAQEPAAAASQLPTVGAYILESATADLLGGHVSAAGLYCDTLDAAPTALSRAVTLMVGPHEKPLALLDIGWSRTTFIVARRGTPVYVRALKDCGLGRVLEEAAPEDHRRIFASESASPGRPTEAARRSQGLPQPLQGLGSRIVSECTRTLNYLRSHLPSAAPAGLVLFGAGACIAGMTAELIRGLQLPTKPWEPNPDTLRLPAALPFPAVLLAPAVAMSLTEWEGSK
jgi:Tfp pilus assembly PilM family ATPase